MNSIVYTLLAQAGDAAASAPAADSTGTGGSLTSWILMIGIFFFIMWFFMIRPRQNEQKKFNQMLNELKTGDKVVTIGGIKASITNVIRNKDNEVIEIQLLLDDKNNVKVMFDPRAIAYVIAPEEDKDKDKEK